jgi:protein O-GlcNAc transferase
MLFGFLKSVLGKSAKGPRPHQIAASIDEIFIAAGEQFNAGKMDEALASYQKVLELDPHHLVAHNQVALCLSRMQRLGEAGAYYERAALIDDSFAPALVNFAIHLNDASRSGEAEVLLEKAQKIVPNDPYVDGVLGAVKMHRGRPHEASERQLSGWLKGFEKAEFAHSYLFNVCYPSDTTAAKITAEHAFWAETMAEDMLADTGWAELASLTDLAQRKIRIGYLSADFRQHSIRYFFRPLLENHDHERFEVFGYYDMVYQDDQTRAMEPHFDHFRTIANQPDADVFKLIRDDRLDILVDLTGHTSLTRIHLMRQRLATLHVNAIGYPPTTGLRGIDYKVVDGRTAPEGSERFYAERLMRLPSSFWCFNPLQETPDPLPPPVLRNGHVTLGCFGNISKISRRVLACWVAIMRELRDCRLVLKAITFKDEEAKISIQHWLDSAGIDLERVTLVPPDEPDQLFASYADIDIVLDTHPFNGGTTSCFALWMAVPFVTLEGEALISRMGASMLRTLGLDDLVAGSDEEYVQAVVALARDTDRLAKIRLELRQRMLDTPLGNGVLFAREFEQACLKALEARRDGSDEEPRPALPVLPEKELVRRADFVRQTGQLAAAIRIADYTLRHYPASTGALIVRSGLHEASGQLQPAKEILTEALASMPQGSDRQSVEVNLTRLDLLLGQYDEAHDRASRLLAAEMDPLGRLHVELYDEAALGWASPARDVRSEPRPARPPSFVSVLVHCDDDERFAEIQSNLADALAAGLYDCVRLTGEARIEQYAEAVAGARGDTVLFVRAKTQVLARDFHEVLTQGLERFDIVGYAGASRLAGTRWFDAGFDEVHGAVVLPNGGPVGGLNLSIYGPSRKTWVAGLRVLDDGLFAARKAVFERVEFDEVFEGEHGLCEADWFVRASEAGFALGISPLLGVARLEFPHHAGPGWHDCAARFRERHGLGEPSETPPVAGASVLLPTLEHAMPLLRRHYTDG